MIYYGTAQGLIKIGYTDKNLIQRTQAHRADRPDYIVLAARDGTMDEEHRTHREFRHLLVDGEREWFNPGPELLSHVVVVARGDYLPPPVLPERVTLSREDRDLIGISDF